MSRLFLKGRKMKRSPTYRLEQLDQIVLLHKLAHLGDDDLLLRSLRVRTLLLPRGIRDGDEESMSRLEFPSIEFESGSGRGLDEEVKSQHSIPRRERERGKEEDELTGERNWM